MGLVPLVFIITTHMTTGAPGTWSSAGVAVLLPI